MLTLLERRVVRRAVKAVTPGGLLTVAEAAAQLAAMCQSATPACGTVRVVAIDGPAGAGKSTLAARVAAVLNNATIVHLDDLYNGWGGLAAGIDRLQILLRALCAGEPATIARYDWAAARYGAPEPLPVADILIVEGVGALAQGIRGFCCTTAWLDAAPDVRKHRAISRGGENFDEHWDYWAQQESEYFAAQQPASAADIRYAGLLN